MAVLAADPEIDAAHDREWSRLATSGSWFTGRERVAIARTARGGDPGAEIGAATAAAAVRIHDEPAAITLDWIEGLEREGLSRLAYVEVLGVVARLRALDTYTFGIGHLLRPLPEPVEGEPSRSTAASATYDGGWVPTVGPAGPPNALSAVPGEHEALHDIHGDLYLTAGPGDGYDMGNMKVVRDGLGRSQMEFVAARTSLLNDCFF